MSLPWDIENLPSNLRTLASLQRGDHLSVLKEGENTGGETYTLGNRGLRPRFKIQPAITQAFVRSKKGESILEDDQFFIPLSRVFQAAVQQWLHQNPAVTGDLIRSAARGLEVLRRTYSKDTKRHAKISQLIKLVDLEVRGIQVQGVFLEPGVHTMVLGEQGYPALRQRVLETITGGNEGINQEYTDKVTQQFQDAVYGKNVPLQNPMYLPIGQIPNYRRKSMGVCKQFYRDAHMGPGVKLNGQRITCGEEDLKRLYEFTESSNGLLFATSQAACQACVGGVAGMILGLGGRDGARQVPLIQVGPQRVNPTFPKTGNFRNITKKGHQILVTARNEITGNENGDCETELLPLPLRDFGISHISFVVSVGLTRANNRIELELVEATLRITTV